MHAYMQLHMDMVNANRIISTTIIINIITRSTRIITDTPITILDMANTILIGMDRERLSDAKF
jgi:hypothetical protein